jgi:hypothetical protein
MERTYLVGVEEVQSAARVIRESAHAMQQAANTIDASITRLLVALEGHAQRLEDALGADSLGR